MVTNLDVIENIDNIIVQNIYIYIWKSNKNVDIKFSAHDTYLESSGRALSQNIGQPNNLKVLGARKPKDN